jgi:hypothetical protein
MVVSLAIVAGLLATPAFAQNLITNPSFDSDTTGWWNSYLDLLNWISDDGNPAGSGPGCLEIGDALNNNGCTGAIQDNIVVTPNTTYVLSGVARLPSGSLAESASIWVEWYDAGGGFLSDSSIHYVTWTVDGPWTPSSQQVVSPANAVEAWVRPSFCMPGSGTEESIARWDDLFFGPQGAEIFVDGFESGDTARWSSVAGFFLCGDGVIEGLEYCDDGNSAACGTCNATCDTSQSGGDCPTGVGCISGLDCISGTCTGGVCE